MSKILTMQEILDAAQESNMPSASIFNELYENLTTLTARALAQHLSIATSDAASEGPHLGGVSVAFCPILETDGCPSVIDQADSTGEWEPLKPRFTSSEDQWPSPIAAGNGEH